jgi:trehalose-phosphatase
MDMRPSVELKALLRQLMEHHTFYLVSGRVHEEMEAWFGDLPEIGIACEHGFRIKAPGLSQFSVQYPGLDFAWKEIVRPIMKMYADSTDGTHVQEKACGLTWAYAAADPDFGRWQVCRAPLARAAYRTVPLLVTIHVADPKRALYVSCDLLAARAARCVLCAAP